MDANKIQPGFRFFPTEEELVSFYLRRQLEGNSPDLNRVIPVIDIYALEPWHLPKLAGERCRGDTEQWFFFSPMQEQEIRGGRPSRTNASGYWKATGSPSYVYSSDNKVIGVKKTMVFYKGKAPKARKTKWKMNEYRAIHEENSSPCGGHTIPRLRHELSLCRVYIVSGSLRAFDRRPLGAERRSTTTHGPPPANQAVHKASSLETSCSGEHQTFQLPQANIGVVQDQPERNCDQPNWLYSLN
ncbi:hypothetical protein NMG60_11033417 [Bertholletia excelsa]